MGEEIAVENGRLSYFQGLVTLTLDWVILHIVMHHSSTSTYTPNVIEIKETFCGRTTYGHLRPSLLGRLGGVNIKIQYNTREKLHRASAAKQRQCWQWTSGESRTSAYGWLRQGLQSSHDVA